MKLPLEQVARESAAAIIAIPDWVAHLVGLVASIRAADLPAPITNRIVAILEEVAADPQSLFGRNADLMPAELGAELRRGAIAVLRDSGATAPSTKVSPR